MKKGALLTKTGIGIGLVLTSLFLITLATLPSFQDIQNLALGSNRFYLDQNQKVIHELRVDLQKRRKLWLPLNSYSQVLQDWVVGIEDKNFFHHPGVDVFALARATYSMASGKRIQGASTISMQTADLIEPSVLLDGQPITKGRVFGKVKQIFRGFAIDLLWSKQEILETYLNLVHLRGEVQGVQSFSQLYLGKSPLFINETEAVVIATLIQAPNRQKDSLIKRSCLLGKGRKTDFSCDKLEAVVDRLQKGAVPMQEPPQLAPHLALRLKSAPTQGNQIQTTIDYDLQLDVQRILEKNLSYLQNRNVHDSAAVVIENKTGHVIAYVGSVKKFSQAHHVDGVNSPRQAGSTLKPFLYGRAIEKKILTASSLIDDSETAIKWEGGLYRPSNYDHKFHGMVTARQALASSLNVPAVKVVRMLGLSESYNVIKGLGFPDFKSTRDTYGASLALGATDIRLLDLANVYRGLANGGLVTPVTFSLQPKVEYGDTHRILSEESAYIISDILSDSDARRMGFNWNSALETRMWSAVKTGTSKDLRDNWCVGFSSEYTVAVWAGNFDGSAMDGVSGVTGAGPSWNEIMHAAHRNRPSHKPTPPAHLIGQKITIENQPGERLEYFLPGTEPNQQRIQLGHGRQIKFEFPVNGSVLTLNPHKRQDSANLMIRYTGDLPEGAWLSFDGKKFQFDEGNLTVPKVARGRHLFTIKSNDGRTLAETRFQLL